MATNNLPSIQNELMSPSIMARLETRLGKKAGTFITSVLDLCGEDKALAACDPKLVVKEALKAAGLDLPVNKNLGFAYVIPYKGIPAFQLGYRGYIQLAIRTGQYRHLNAGIVYEGEEIIENRIKGKIEISGKKTSDKAIGYFAYMELLNGFNKAVAWSKENVQAHAKRFSKSFNSGSSPWKTDFDAMALKTMILQLKTYFPMTIEMSEALSNDHSDVKAFDSDTQMEIANNANTEVIDIQTEDANPGEMSDSEKAEIEAAEKAQATEETKGPGF